MDCDDDGHETVWYSAFCGIKAAPEMCKLHSVCNVDACMEGKDTWCLCSSEWEGPKYLLATLLLTVVPVTVSCYKYNIRALRGSRGDAL